MGSISNPPVTVSEFKELDDVQVVLKAADESVNNSNVLQDDDELFFPVLAGEVWEFKIIIKTYSPSDTPDIKWSLTMPVNAHTYRTLGVSLNASGSPAVDNVAEGNSGVIYASNQVNVVSVFSGVIVVGATAGNLRFQWAQNTATVEDTLVKAGSCIIARKLN